MYIGVDLGSTNIKAAIYDKEFCLLDRQSRPVNYIRENGFVEFDAEAYLADLVGLLGDMMRSNGVSHVDEIAFTGQAESLVVLGADGKPLMNAISWMDERSVEECKELSEKFDSRTCEEITGQMAVLPTWPATKILWLKRNRPEIYENAATYMLLKDYIIYGLTGEKKADMSIATFSFYFDIYNKCYWQEMLEAIGISEKQLPQLCEPCSVASNLTAEVAEKMGLTTVTRVNVGTLDHFAGMIGTGNIAPGGITLSTGTVMALATMASEATPKNTGIAMHYGFLPDTHVMLPVAESGGVSLEWFKRSCMAVDYDTMNRELAVREPNELLFLPYLVGTNAPEFDAEANGVFWGLRQEHDAIDMAVGGGTPIYATNSGRIYFADWLGLTGNTVIIDHGCGIMSWHYHLHKINVAEGDYIEKGTVIGTVGTTGLSTGNHLHFGITVGGVFVDPNHFFGTEPNFDFEKVKTE